MLIRTYGDELLSEEVRNNRKLDVVNRAALLLMIGVLELASEGGTLAVQHLIMSGPAKQSSSVVAPAASRPGVVRPTLSRHTPPEKLPLGLLKKG